MSSRRYVTALSLLAAAAVLYSGVPWEWIFGTSLNPSTSYLSELAALDQPASGAFRVLDSLAGVAMAAAAVVVWPAVRRWPARCAVAALGIFGVGTILDIVFPMTCATSVTQACAALEARGDLGVGHAIHTYASVMADGGAVVLAAAVVVMCISRRPKPTSADSDPSVRADPARNPARSGSRWGARWVALVAAVVSISSSAVVSVMALMPLPGQPLPAGTGYVQRIQTLAFCVMLLTLAPLLRRTFTSTPERPEPVPQPMAYSGQVGSP